MFFEGKKHKKGKVKKVGILTEDFNVLQAIAEKDL
jgi:hypothetical protein